MGSRWKEGKKDNLGPEPLVYSASVSSWLSGLHTFMSPSPSPWSCPSRTRFSHRSLGMWQPGGWGVQETLPGQKGRKGQPCSRPLEIQGPPREYRHVLTDLPPEYPSVCKKNTGLTRWHSGKDSACQCRTHRRHGFDPLEYEMATHSNILAWKMSWTPQRSLAGYSPWGRKEWDTTEQLRVRAHTRTHTHTHTRTHTHTEWFPPFGVRGGHFFLSTVMSMESHWTVIYT